MAVVGRPGAEPIGGAPRTGKQQGQRAVAGSRPAAAAQPPDPRAAAITRSGKPAGD